jgi:hypothetical protein
MADLLFELDEFVVYPFVEALTWLKTANSRFI